MQGDFVFKILLERVLGFFAFKMSIKKREARIRTSTPVNLLFAKGNYACCKRFSLTFVASLPTLSRK